MLAFRRESRYGETQAPRMSPPEQRKLAAIMFTDMVGYSALSQRDEALALELLEEHRRLLRGIVPRHEGREVKAMGDGFLFEFPSALSAVQGALEIQQVLHTRNQAVPAAKQLRIRIGIHVGDVVMREGDIHGDGVNIAARLEPLAAPGGICVSEDVARAVRNKVTQPLEPLAATDLKNIDLPMAVYRVVLPWDATALAPNPVAKGKVSSVAWILFGGLLLAGLALAFWRPWRTRDRPVAPPPAAVAAPADKKSIAVLPFANMSPDAENAFFADGVHEDVITNLAKIRDLKVISRTSVMPYRSGDRNLKKIAAELGVATVLEGSVRRSGGKVRVTAQLIDAGTDQHLWAETYDRDLTDVFAIQSALASEIATALKANLTTNERALIADRPTQDQEAYDFYQRANALTSDREDLDARNNLEQAIKLYEQAIVKDPSFALAYVGLSLANGWLYWFSNLDPTPERLARQKAALDGAIRLAPDRPETRMAKGAFYYVGLRDIPKALEEFEAAEKGLPNDDVLQSFLAFANRRLGRWEKALSHMERSIALNPRGRVAYSSLVDTLMIMRRYPAALAAAKRGLTAFPGDRSMQNSAVLAQYETDGDRAAYLHHQWMRPPAAYDPLGIQTAFELAMLEGDLAGADRALNDARLTVMTSVGGVEIEPAVLHRAWIAFLRGQPDQAKKFADETIAYFGARSWNARQQTLVNVAVGQAHALAGRREEALASARAGLAAIGDRDRLDRSIVVQGVGRIYIVLGMKDEAFVSLKEMVEGPANMIPREIPYDAVWSRLKEDPRFDEILKSAKPL